MDSSAAKQRMSYLKMVVKFQGLFLRPNVNQQVVGRLNRKHKDCIDKLKTRLCVQWHLTLASSAAIRQVHYGSYKDTQTRLVYQSPRLNWLIWMDSFFFFAKLIELIQLLFQASWLVTEAIRFHKVGDWVDWLWATGMSESIQLMQKNAKKGQRNRRF